ncbi:MAG: proteasome assembly chaperone family protein [Methanophagales archaeon ANME-1-THS]|nr:MAG: proteasome assembly chaperone family protein [Methanophagales archaeon ANME-1-THS]
MHLKIYEEPQLRNPRVIVGLPGIGNVAKISADYLIKQLDARLFAAFYSPVFPPYVLVGKGRYVELLNNEFYYWKATRSSSDLIILTGNTQASTPKAQYVVAEALLDYLAGFEVTKLISMAAYVVDKPVEKPNVYAAATHPELLVDLKQYGVIPMGEGSIGGANGLLVGLARARNIPGICLLSETLPGYITSAGGILADPKAARALLEVLSKILGLDIDLSDLAAAVRLTYGASSGMEDELPAEDEPSGMSTRPGDYSYI